MTDTSKAFLHLEKTTEENSARPRSGNERFTKPALCFEPLRHSADLSGHGRRGQRDRDQACDFRSQSSRLPSVQFQTTAPRRVGTRFFVAHTRRLPERGRIGIFNRSYYEEVLVVRVHPELLRAEGFSDDTVSNKFWQDRYQSIYDLEAHLHRNATRIVNSFSIFPRRNNANGSLRGSTSRTRTGNSIAAISRKENTGTITWKRTRTAWEPTSTRQSPWHVVPADDKANARMIISGIILDTLN